MAQSLTVDAREGHLGLTCSTSRIMSGVRVDAVHEKDLMYRAGLRVGMVIQTVNTQGVSCHDYAMDLMNTCKENQEKITLTYFSEEEAIQQGAKESTQQRKLVVFLFLGVLSIVLLSWVGVLPSASQLIKLLPQPMNSSKLKASTVMDEWKLLADEFKEYHSPELMESQDA